MRFQALTPLIAVLLFFVLLFGLPKILGPVPFSISSTTTTKSDSFSVDGEGRVFIKPDIAIVNVGVQATGATVKQVQDQLNANATKVSASIKRVGVEEKDIQTTNYSINPTYDYRESAQRIIGYQAHASLTVKVRALDKVNEVIDQATANGANQVGGVSFDVDDREKAENEARKLAVDDAKKKAQEAASTAGFRLGKIINYSEGPTTVPPVARQLKLDSAAEVQQAPTQVEPGNTEIVVRVSISYQVD